MRFLSPPPSYCVPSFIINHWSPSRDTHRRKNLWSPSIFLCFLLLSYQLPSLSWAASVSMATVPVLSSPGYLSAARSQWPAATPGPWPCSSVPLPGGDARLSLRVHVPPQNAAPLQTTRTQNFWPLLPVAADRTGSHSR